MTSPHARRARRLLCLCVLQSWLLACGGTASNEPIGEPAGPAASGASSGPTTPRPSSTTNPGSTLTFEVGSVAATRMPMHAACDEANAPFTDEDRFALQPVAAAPSAKVRSIAIGFRRTVTIGSPLSLVDGPGGGATFDGARHAHSLDLKAGVDLVVFGPAVNDGETPPVMTALTRATVTMLEVPAQDGTPTSARVELHFADGSVLDATFSAPLVSYKGACATPR